MMIEIKEEENKINIEILKTGIIYGIFGLILAGLSTGILISGFIMGFPDISPINRILVIISMIIAVLLSHLCAIKLKSLKGKKILVD